MKITADTHLLRLSQLRPGSTFRVAGAHARLELLSIDKGEHASTIRVRNTDTGIGYVYCWQNSTPVFNVVQ